MPDSALVKKNIPDESRVLWINNAKTFSAFIVIFLHISGEIVFHVPDINGFQWWVGNIFDSLARWCIPVFVMLSGILLLDVNKDESIWVFYKKRISRILIPIIFWTIFFLIYQYYQTYFTNGTHLSIRSLLDSMVSGIPYFHMWYLYMIIGLYLFAPFLRKIVKHSSNNEPIFFCILSFAFSMACTYYLMYRSNINIPATFKFVFYVPYFLAGYLINKTKFNPPVWILCAILLLSIILTGAGYHATRAAGSNNSYFYEYLSVTVVPMSLSLLFLLKKFKKPLISSNVSNQLALLSFGIYLIHPAILSALPFFGVRLLTYNPLFALPFFAILIFILALISSFIISKIPLLRKVIGLS
jgi:surface polysaccharide O-acyltransferase-like enzyme